MSADNPEPGDLFRRHEDSVCMIFQDTSGELLELIFWRYDSTLEVYDHNPDEIKDYTFIGNIQNKLVDFMQGLLK